MSVENEKTCPICGFELVSPDEKNCPQCDADLTCFKVLNSIPDEPGREESRSIQTGREEGPSGNRLILVAFSLLVVGLIMGLFLASWRKSEDPSISVSDQKALPVRIKIPDRSVSGCATADVDIDLKAPALSRIMTVENTLVSEGVPETAAFPAKPPPGAQADHGERSGSAREKDLTAAPAPEQENFRLYKAAHEDTLWRISKKAYGSGHYFPVLMECNPEIRIHDVHSGMAIRIFRDPRMAQKLYHENSCIQGERAYYHYLVREGDTFESLALKFYGQVNMKNRIINLNPHVTLRDGMRIRIELE